MILLIHSDMVDYMDDKEIALKIVLKLLDKKLIKDIENPAKEIAEAYHTVLKTIQSHESSDAAQSIADRVSNSLKAEEQ